MTALRTVKHEAGDVLQSKMMSNASNVCQCVVFKGRRMFILRSRLWLNIKKVSLLLFSIYIILFTEDSVEDTKHKLNEKDGFFGVKSEKKINQRLQNC